MRMEMLFTISHMKRVAGERVGAHVCLTSPIYIGYQIEEVAVHTCPSNVAERVFPCPL
jgi:hypothetical protein